ILNSNYCSAEWLLPLNGSPSTEYLNRFDAVIWSESNKIIPIDANQSETLIEFVLNGGKLLLEGQDIAFNHFDDNFMQYAAHATLFSDLILDENSNESIIISRKHPITFDFNSLDFNYELSPFPDSVIPVNNGHSIAKWNSGNSAITLFNDFNSSQAKVLFFAFNLNALNSEERTSLLNNAVEWLTENPQEDLKVNEISVPELIIEDAEFDLNISLENTNTTQGSKIQIFSDNELIKTINSNSNSITETISLSQGNHVIKVFINSDFSLKEKYYLNNSLEKKVFVASQQADLKIKSLQTTTIIDSQITTEIENIGGSNAENALIELYYDNNKVYEENLDVNSNQTQTVSVSVPKETGIHVIQAKVNPQQTIPEADYNNNSLEKELYVCSKENILIVNDNDTENNTTVNPDSTNTFEEILKNNGYCFETWNEKTQGIPSISHLNQFNILIWSTGNYWNTVIDKNEMNLLQSYNKNILFEGADIAFDHSNDNFLEETLHAEFDKDLSIQQEQLNLSSHEILNNISQITIDGNFSPYPDSINPIDSNTVAEWPDANASIISYSNTNKKIIYFAFSIDSIIEENSKELLVVNSIEFLKQTTIESQCGDTTRDGFIDIDDIIFLVNYVFTGGPAPEPIETGNVNLQDEIDIDDIIYLINYIFLGGPEPCSPPKNYTKTADDSWTINDVEKYLNNAQKNLK
ncbi:hypothetical protein KKG83_01410, partial [Candidatus Micrarchaeota archaeon]|nr:hypothetical protein [Candidatus Micrarchaeota archaeon]